MQKLSELISSKTFKIANCNFEATEMNFQNISFYSSQDLSDLQKLPAQKTTENITVSGKISKERVHEYYVNVLD